MSKYESIFEVRGKIGATTFQKRKGSLILGKTSSLSKDRIKNAEEFQRTRENMSEFKGCASATKSLRNGLGPVAKRFKDGRMVSRMNGVFRKILKAGTGIRGQRPIEIVANKVHLVGAELIRETPFSQMFIAPISWSVNPDRNQVTVTVQPFAMNGMLTVPQGATDWRLVLAISALSDRVYDSVTGGYMPVDATLDQLGNLVESSLISVQGALTAPLQLVATLPNSPVLPSTVGLVACLGIEFSQNVSNIPYVLAQHNAMRVVDVF